MKHVVMVAFHYPPEASSSGVLRTLKYTQYLAEAGWRSTVITVRPDAYDVVDPELEKTIPETTRVVRTRFLNVKRHLSIRGRYLATLAVPDTWSGWWWFGRKAGRAVIASDPPDLIYSTSPHATAHLIARSLAAGSGLPWVMDFRDPWYEEPPEEGTPAVVHWWARRLEAWTVRDASAVVASTAQLRDSLRRRYPAGPTSKFNFIMNGYDESDFAGLEPATADSSVLDIVHTGSVNRTFRDPRPLIEALRRAVDRGALGADEIGLRFLGAGRPEELGWLTDCAQACDLGHAIKIQPRVGYHRALGELAKCTVSLLLQASPDTVDLVPAKLYEYLRIGRPVLGLLNDGATQQLVDGLGAGWTADPSRADAMDRAVGEIVDAWREDTLARRTARIEDIRRYSRQSLAKELAELFEGLTGDKRHA